MKMRLTLLVAILSLITAFTPAALAEDETIITIEGSGWGHGVGMSQYGAYGRALPIEDGGGGAFYIFLKKNKSLPIRFLRTSKSTSSVA